MATPVKTGFTKPAKSPRDLVTKLTAQQLLIPDTNEAIKYITFVGHFRLKGYWYHLIDPATKRFKQGTSFSIIRDRYEFDREIRALIMETIERLEVAIRNTICNFLSLKYTPHWYLNSTVLKHTLDAGMGQLLSKIEQEVKRSKDKAFLKNFYDKYDDPYLPPAWAMCECVTIGTWSRIFKTLRDPVDKKQISSKFGISQHEVFESWVHTLTVVRNMAAHHNRFLNTKLGVSPTNCKAKQLVFADNKNVYSSLTVIHVLLDAIGFNSKYRSRLVDLETQYGLAMLQELGFPQNWQTAPGW